MGIWLVVYKREMFLRISVVEYTGVDCFVLAFYIVCLFGLYWFSSLVLFKFKLGLIYGSRSGRKRERGGGIFWLFVIGCDVDLKDCVLFVFFFDFFSWYY